MHPPMTPRMRRQSTISKMGNNKFLKKLIDFALIKHTMTTTLRNDTNWVPPNAKGFILMNYNGNIMITSIIS